MILIIGHGPSCLESLENPEGYEYVIRMKEQAGPPGKITHFVYRDCGPAPMAVNAVNWEVDEIRGLWSKWWGERSGVKASVGLAAIFGAVDHLHAEAITLVGFDSHNGIGRRYGRGIGWPHDWPAEKAAAHDLVEITYGKVA